MTKTPTPGLHKRSQITIDGARCIEFLGKDAQVYSTPALLQDIEVCCRDLLLEHTDENQDSVGISVTLNHLAASLLGMQATLEVTITEVTGPKISFTFTGRDALEQICTGTHQRFIVDRQKTRARLLAKAEKYPT